MYSLKNKFIASRVFILLTGLIMTWSCEQDDLSSENPSDQAFSAGKIVTAYSVDVMQQALDVLIEDPTFNAEDIDVEENYQYVRFKLPEEASHEELEETADIFDFPIYGSDLVGAEETNDGNLYGIIPADGSFPLKNVTLLSSLYLPEHLADVQDREEDIARLEQKAYEIAGWPLEVPQAEESGRLGKWRPGGAIKALDGNGNAFPVPQLIVKIRKNITPNKWKTAVTDKDGKFRWPGERPNISVVYHFQYHTQTPPSVYYPPTEVGNLTPYELRVKDNRILISSGKRKSPFNVTLGAKNDNDHVFGKLYAEALKQYLQFRASVEKEITTDAFYMWQQAREKLYVSISPGKDTEEAFTYVNEDDYLKLNFPGLSGRTRLDEAILLMQLIEGFEYHRLSNTGSKTMDDDLKRTLALIVGYEAIRNGSYSDVIGQLNDKLQNHPNIAFSSFILDLMDSESQAHPLGINGSLDGIKSLTWDGLLKHVKLARSNDALLGRFIKLRIASETKLKNLYAARFQGWYLMSEGRNLLPKVSDNSIRGNKLKVGDFNGDGKDDLFYLEEVNRQGFVYYDIYQEPVPIASFEKEGNFLIGDINGDGLDDLFQNTGSEYVAYYAPNWEKELLATLDANERFKINSGDFNGDGKMDLFRAGESTTKVLYIKYECKGEWKSLELAGGQITFSPYDIEKCLIGDFIGNQFGGHEDDLLIVNDRETKILQVAFFSRSKVVSHDLRHVMDGVPNTTFGAFSAGGNFFGDEKQDVLHFNKKWDLFSETSLNYPFNKPITLNDLRGNKEFFIKPLKSRTVIGDFNGDGKSDVLYTAPGEAE